jgi:hypothetical protein
MAGQWYFTREGKRQGPVTLEQLKAMAASGLLTQKDMILEDGSGKWGQVGSVQGLFDMPQAVAVPEPPVSAILGAAQPVIPSPPPMPTPFLWYYAKNGQQYGPIPEEHLKALVASGQLQPSDMAWKAGTPSWLPIGQGLLMPPPLPLYRLAVAPSLKQEESRELEYLRMPDGYVTSTRAELNGVTYAIENLTSVLMKKKVNEGAVLLIIVSILLIIESMLVGLASETPLMAFALFACLALGIWVLIHPNYVVIIATAGDQSHAWTSKSKKDVRAVVNAIKTAIINRGQD